MSTTVISVLVSTRNRPNTLLRCLQSIERQEVLSNYTIEVLVLDDAPEIDANSVIMRFKDKMHIKYFRSKERLGVPGARNYLLTRTLGVFGVIIDDDAEFANSDSLMQVADVFGQNRDVGLLAFNITDEPSGKKHVPFSRMALWKDPALLDRQQAVSCFNGGGYALRLEVVDEVGVHDSTLLYGCEELDLSYRVVDGRWKIVFVPTIEVVHHPSLATFSNDEKLYYALRNRLWLARRYLPIRYGIVFCMVWIIRVGAILLFRRCPRLFLRAILDGATHPHRRKVLAVDSLRYLRENHGRLWM